METITSIIHEVDDDKKKEMQGTKRKKVNHGIVAPARRASLNK